MPDANQHGFSDDKAHIDGTQRRLSDMSNISEEGLQE
jgi:hypothetical protein